MQRADSKHESFTSSLPASILWVSSFCPADQESSRSAFYHRPKRQAFESPGAVGHTYGAHEAWIMHKHSNPSLPLTTHNEIEWEEALELKGANEMKHAKQLMLSLDFFSRKPDLDIITQNPNDPAGKLVTCSGKGYSLVYTPTSKEIVIDRSKLDFQNFDSHGFNPQDGSRQPAAFSGEDELCRFDPPGEIKRGNDWVLVLEKKDEINEERPNDNLQLIVQAIAKLLPQGYSDQTVLPPVGDHSAPSVSVGQDHPRDVESPRQRLLDRPVRRKGHIDIRAGNAPASPGN